jgi:hypothetical protein
LVNPKIKTDIIIASGIVTLTGTNRCDRIMYTARPAIKGPTNAKGKYAYAGDCVDDDSNRIVKRIKRDSY